MQVSLIDNLQMPATFIHESSGQYSVQGALTEQDIIQAAQAILGQKFTQGDVLSSHEIAWKFFTTQLAMLEHEVFCVAFLNTQLKVLACEQMFSGTIDTARVYPREVVKRALALNAASVIFAHNHPSGTAEISQADQIITEKLTDALQLVDIRVVDHLVIGGTQVSSFVQKGLL